MYTRRCTIEDGGSRRASLIFVIDLFLDRATTLCLDHLLHLCVVVLDISCLLFVFGVRGFFVGVFAVPSASSSLAFIVLAARFLPVAGVAGSAGLSPRWSWDAASRNFCTR